MLSPTATAALQAALAAHPALSGRTLAIATPTEVLFSGSAGPFDPLQPERGVGEGDVMWFASTTKLLTAVSYLQLIDRGHLTLSTNMRTLYPPLDAAASRIITGFDDTGHPITVPNDAPITLAQMLNQTSGFGREFGERVQGWKRTAEKGAGFVNSCKVENLIHTPLAFAPGTSFDYGNSAEWLGLILPTITGMEMEDYLQENVLRPLGMHNTTFFPFGEEWDGRLMPLRFRGDDGFEELTDQLPLLTLPRTRAEIEYPVSGGGIYSTSRDYLSLLQHLLAHYLSLSGRAPRPSAPLLSDDSVASLFRPSLPDAAKGPVAEFLAWYFDEPVAEGEGDWSTAVALWLPKDGRRRGGNGRYKGSAGWGGAAGTSYWMDPEKGIAVVFSVQQLPGSGPALSAFKNSMEEAIYAALE